MYLIRGILLENPIFCALLAQLISIQKLIMSKRIGRTLHPLSDNMTYGHQRKKYPQNFLNALSINPFRILSPTNSDSWCKYSNTYFSCLGPWTIYMCLPLKFDRITNRLIMNEATFYFIIL